jgi:hypothetical protein
MRHGFTVLLAGWLSLTLLSATPAGAVIRPETVSAFDRYLQNLEQRRAEQQKSGCYLSIDCSPELKQAVLTGQIVVEPITAVMPRVEMRVPGGEIRHTFGAIFLPGENISQIRHVLDDYPNFPRIYGPDIVTARLTSQSEQDQEFFMRLRKHFVITVVLNMNCRAQWTKLDATHAVEHTTATHIGEAQDPDKPDAGDRTPEQDRGFLWRYESYWRLEETGQGVLLEHEIISLSRRVPVSLRFMLRPILQRLPQEAMYNSVLATRRQLQQRPKDGGSVATGRSTGLQPVLHSFK